MNQPSQTGNLTGPVLITGGAGFLGSNLAARLCERGLGVRLLDNLARNSLPYMDNPALKKAELIEGDITEAAICEKALAGVETVVHMAAIAGVHNYYETPHRVMQVNIGGILALLRAMESCSVRRLVFLSSSEVYGTHARDAKETDPLPVTEMKDMRWTYAVSKIAGEKACLAFGNQTGISVVILRPFNVFGPGQTGEGAVRDMIKTVLAKEPLTVHGDGSQVRAWCHVDDFVDAAVAALDHPDLSAEIFNVGNPDSSVTVAELAESIVRAVDYQVNIHNKPHFGTDIRYRTPNIDHAKRILGFAPKITLEKGLKETVEWYRKHDA